jgi:hypothetical protein
MEYGDRRKFVRESLIPRVIRTQKTPSGLRLVFENSQSLRSDVELFVELESGCCGFLDFEITSGTEGLVLTIEGPDEAREVLASFLGAAAGSGSLLRAAEGSLSRTAEGSLLRAAEGSLSRTAEGSLSRTAEGSLSRTAEGSLSRTAES